MCTHPWLQNGDRIRFVRCQIDSVSGILGGSNTSMEDNDSERAPPSRIHSTRDREGILDRWPDGGSDVRTQRSQSKSEMFVSRSSVLAVPHVTAISMSLYKSKPGRFPALVYS